MAVAMVKWMGSWPVATKEVWSAIPEGDRSAELMVLQRVEVLLVLWVAW